MSLTPAQIEQRLEDIEQEIADRELEYEEVADRYTRLTREFDLRVALVKTKVNEKTETAKKDQALIAIAAADDGLYERFTDAEARYNALRAALNSREKRAMIGMGLLKSHGRVDFVPKPQRWAA